MGSLKKIFLCNILTALIAGLSANNMAMTKDVNKLVILDDKTFHDHIAKGINFVLFYLPSCPHCQKFMPTWKEFANSNDAEDKLSIAQIDCRAFKPICTEFKINVTFSPFKSVRHKILMFNFRDILQCCGLKTEEQLKHMRETEQLRI